MNNWCESCARKNVCYTPDIRPKCYLPTTNTEIICPEEEDNSEGKVMKRERKEDNSHGA